MGMLRKLWEHFLWNMTDPTDPSQGSRDSLSKNPSTSGAAALRMESNTYESELPRYPEMD